MRAWVYRGDAPVEGALLLVPGLHYLGPADPRLDRLCRVFASARLLVLCPFLPDFGRLRVAPTLGSDATRAYDALVALPDFPAGVVPGIFSISFGSLPALQVAASRPAGGLMMFGGYADWAETMRFSLEGTEGRPYDPLNRPVVFNNLLPFFEGVDEEAVRVAIFEQVRATWGRPEMKEPGALEPSAMRLASSLDSDSIELFLQATGMRPGGNERAFEALERAGSAFDHLDPVPWASQVAIPALVAHGREDDVIPYEHAPRLAAMIPSARCVITGIYAHTGQAGLLDLVPRARDELSAMIQLLRAMARIGCGMPTSRSY